MKKSNISKIFLPRPIVLLGMMGAGKSSVGKALASIIDAPFFDADVEIEAAAGCTIAQIFSTYGEEEFRRLERQVIARLLSGEPCVLSLGGGAFMNDETRERIQKAAFSVWLKVDHALLLERVLRHGERPLLKDGDPAKRMAHLLAEREPIYGLAKLAVLCDDRPVPQTAQNVWDAIRVAPDFQNP